MAEGNVSELHIGLKGAMNALFIRDLAARTHRGLRGGVAAGKSAGGLSCSSKPIRRIDERGEPVRGDRIIDDGEAAIVKRIFRMFSEGQTPVAIAKALKAESIPGPGDRAWRGTTIYGHAGRGTGILRNELEVGRLVCDGMRLTKDPSMAKRVTRMNHVDQWLCEEVPALHIIDQELWTQVQSRLALLREAVGTNKPTGRSCAPFRHAPQPRRTVPQ